MSRTYRRKGVEYKRAYDSLNLKVAGAYTECDWIFTPGCGHSCMTVFREPTKREHYKTYRMLHLDAGGFYGGCSRWVCRLEQKRDRRKHSLKITHFLKGKSDDVVCESHQKNPSWNW